MKTILILDDDKNFNRITSSNLRKSGWDVVTTENSQDFLSRLKEKEDEYTAFLLDLHINDEYGLDVLKKALKIHPDAPIMICTAFASIETAVEAMKLGALDYITKPVNYEEMILKLEKIYRQRIQTEEKISLEKNYRLRMGFNDLIGSGLEMRKVIELCKTGMNSDSTILIYGETGTGKELISRAIHYESNRASHPFVLVNCAGLQENLMESELFGHVKGSFTGAIANKTGKFELAGNGSIFLDEIGELSFDMQKKFLRVLQENEFEPVGSSKVIKNNCRVIAATNRDLKQMVEKGKFREDLYYRLNVFPVHIPSLRERKGDIPLLVQYFAGKSCEKYSKTGLKISKSFYNKISTLEFKGNVRELEHLVERCVILSNGQELEFYPSNMYLDPNDSVNAEDYNLKYYDYIGKCEKNYIIRLLEKFNGNKIRAAEFAGITRKTIYQKLHDFHIQF
ncbi:MAG: sigma-54-dependent Fis family transcriptional regulator [Candidatus Aureabacteria bacterium]|nr:sigma-54-dependent Fis family transcriptional regulator [Candidatus Auribacterota bacterium]